MGPSIPDMPCASSSFPWHCGSSYASHQPIPESDQELVPGRGDCSGPGVKRGGHASTATMTTAQLSQVAVSIRKNYTKRSLPDHSCKQKLRALWICVHCLGMIDNPSDAARRTVRRYVKG